MASPELQKLTASEPLSLDEEYQMQESWRQDEDSKIILRFIKHKVNGSHFIFQNLFVITLILATFRASSAIVADGTLCFEELDRSSVFTAVPLADDDVISVAKCIDACPTMNPSFTHVAISNARTCLCGSVTSTFKRAHFFLNCFLVNL